ncbi:MAG TPA: hypothetical protein DHW71_01785 [Gammaproteobacteria bacterium]|nr:hypothetical protein [Gammaproteobacteria bacterium]MEC8010913.1 zf-HC2 domain-containing protein [Pseudomonadota bacterium]HBF08611.1 hypothetical protein [Gammaproteobacteria bacterium]HCK91684.1 hypothetical protein [Gammaproteobacteria bacterium]|tara:strand:- start:508 stop:729 length:222 start_codon:yes stop_codon:yes gene_type:complete
MKHCEAITFLISESQDRSLTLGERFRLKTHLMMCRHCRTYEQSVHQIRDMMKSYSSLDEVSSTETQRPDPRNH